MASNSASPEPSPRKAYRLMAGFAVSIILLLAVAIYSLSRTETKPWASPVQSTPKITADSPRDLPPFEAQIGNKTLAQLTGKWSLISFWSYTCAPCLEELPYLNQLALFWQGPELQILTINVDSGEDLENSKRFIAEQEIALPTYYDSQMKMAKAFNVQAYPKHFLVNREGKIVWEALGAFRWNEQATKDQLLKVIAQPAPAAADSEAEAPAE